MKLNSIAYLLLFVALLSPLSSQAFCLFNCPPKIEKNPEEVLRINPVETEVQAREAQAVLVQLQTEMLSRFNSIETAMNRGATTEALRESKAVLDQVRIKIGVDPKVKMRESFYVNTQFPTDAQAFLDLNETQQGLIIHTIRNFRGGLFMDLMNLSKRVSLIYSRAFKAELKKQGGLTEEDRNKIIRDLVMASLVPMPVVDKNNKKLIVFDEDVANEDHTYLFNRELKMALISDRDLSISEESFGKYKAQVKESLLPATIKKTKSTYEDAMQCIYQANSILYESSRNNAHRTCFDRHYKTLANGNECTNLASEILYESTRNSAQGACFEQYSK